MANINTGSANASKIRYKTHHNNLASQKAGKDMNIAMVQTAKTYSLTELAELIAADGSFMDEPDIVYVLSRLSVKMQQLLITGNAVDVGGLVTLRPVITGAIEEDGSFNKELNKIRIKATVGNILREIAKDATLEKIGGTATPEITAVFNTVDFTNDVLYGGGETAEMEGKLLSFNPDATDEGLFISCPEYEGDDLSLTFIKGDNSTIKFKVNGAIDAEYTAFVSFKTRLGDKNAEPVEVKREVTVKPAVG